MGWDDDKLIGLKPVGQITIRGRFVQPGDPTPGSTCKAEPCSHCGGCEVCGDFHGNAIGGCTDETCPRLKARVLV